PYSWAQVFGPGVTLSGGGTALASFIAPEIASDADVRLRLTVTDPGGLSSTSDVTITIRGFDRPPVANVVATNIIAEERTTVRLDATPSVDPDGDTLEFFWTQTAGPAVALSGAHAAVATFTAPDVEKID